MKKKTRHH